MVGGYSEIAQNHFQYPRNVGMLLEASATGQAENPASGASVVLHLSVTCGVIDKAMFQAQGCAATIAAGSMVTELLIGNPLCFAEKLTRADVEKALGGLPPTRKHAADLVVEAVKAALVHLASRAQE